MSRFKCGIRFCALVLLLYLSVYLLVRRPSQQASEEDSLADASFIRTIVAVGDLHSHFPNALKVLQLAEAVDENGDWSGKVDYFVQTGDLVDRGADTIQIYRWMEQLRAQALLKGGRLLSHLGNHEYMNIIGDWRYVYSSDLETFKSIEARQLAFSSQGWIGQTLAQNYSVTSRLPLHPSAGHDPHSDFEPKTPPVSSTWNAALSFVHGGIHPSLPFLTPYPSRINDIGRTWITRLHRRDPQPPPHPPAPYPGLPVGTTEEEQILYGENGPLWFRGWAQQIENNEFCEIADSLMAKIGVRRLIMGHTPNFERIVSKCNGKVIIIDTGVTPAYGGILSALKIVYGLIPLEPLVPLGVDNHAKRRWKEVEIVTAIYEKHHQQLARSDRVITGDF